MYGQGTHECLSCLRQDQAAETGEKENELRLVNPGLQTTHRRDSRVN
jgi:hypothetical protein